MCQSIEPDIPGGTNEVRRKPVQTIIPPEFFNWAEEPQVITTSNRVRRKPVPQEFSTWTEEPQVITTVRFTTILETTVAD
jgi:hypothetical protein